ncbi:MAG: hypothetical protein LBS77_07515 [Desulfovibrio sp.]|nr:hypothetical protein [Desulfovibrio sp.]
MSWIVDGCCDRPRTLTLDMAGGNILTCQNFSADAVGTRGERHCLGSIFDLPTRADAPMSELVRWKERREHCRDCAAGPIHFARREGR